MRTGAFIAKRRPPSDVREQLDYRADIDGSTVTIVSVRPRYDDPDKKIDHAIARVRWIGTKNRWQLYWMRADLKWHAYESSSVIKTIGDALEEVDRDPHGCFFGRNKEGLTRRPIPSVALAVDVRQHTRFSDIILKEKAPWPST